MLQFSFKILINKQDGDKDNSLQLFIVTSYTRKKNSVVDTFAIAKKKRDSNKSGYNML